MLASDKGDELLKLEGSEEILETHHPVKSWLKAAASRNMASILVTAAVFQEDISPLKSEL